MRLGLIGLLMIGGAATAAAQQQGPVGKDEIPAEYKPPKGMCRIWLKDVPPKQQPAPTECAVAVKNVPQNGRVIFGDIDIKKGGAVPATAKGYVGAKDTSPVKPKKPPLR